MELKKFKQKLEKIKDSRSTNKIWLISEQIAKLTDTHPTRWLRDVKNHEQAIKRAIIDFKESRNIKNKPALFIYLLKKHKTQRELF